MKGPVICGVEDPSSVGAVKVAGELARKHDLPLVYVHVVAEDEDDESLERRRQEAAAPAVFILARSHHPTDCLLEIARERDASFLVLGNHGPRSSLLGSVSAEIARRAPCPVVVVPPTVDESAGHGREADEAAWRAPGPVVVVAPPVDAPAGHGRGVDVVGGVVRLPSHNGGIRRVR